MAKTSRASAADRIDAEGFEGHYQRLEGYTVGYETYSNHVDFAPMFVGLPDNRCQCTHLGIVLRGTLKYRYADGSEDVIQAGEAYVARPGHTPELYPDTEVVEFSPTDELAKTVEVVMANRKKAAQ